MRTPYTLIMAGSLAVALTAPVSAVAVDDAAKIFEDSCSGCHNAGTRPLDKIRLTREQWKETIERMAGLGADVPSGKKLEQLLDYLVKSFGIEK